MDKKDEIIIKAADFIEILKTENAALKEKLQMAVETIESLEFEIDALRLYGNKDCTAVADNFIAKSERPL